MKILKKFLVIFFKIFVKIRFHFGCALILTLLTRPLSGKRKYRVLALRKSIFNEDLKAINLVSSELQFLSFPRLLLSEIIKNYVDNFEELNDSTYHRLIDGTPEQKKIYNAIYSVFKYLKWMLNFDVIFAGNYVYVSQQELFIVAKEFRIPVIILYKEGIGASIKSSSEISKKMYSGKFFFGHSIFFYNLAIKKMLVNANISGIYNDNTHVVGIPRLDHYIKLKNEQSKEKHITLFSFEPFIKAQRFVDDSSKIDEYIERGERFHFDFIKFCIDFPDYFLTIKTKNNPSSKNAIIKLLRNYGIEKLPSNVKISTTSDPIKLIEDSQFIAGSLSTTLLEAMLLDKYILCPYFKDLIPNDRIDFFDDYPKSVNYTKDYNDIKNTLLKKNDLNLASEKYKKIILEPLMYKIDGNSSARTVNKVIEIIESIK